MHTHHDPSDRLIIAWKHAHKCIQTHVMTPQDEYDDTYEDLGAVQAQDSVDDELHAKISRSKFINKGDAEDDLPSNPYVRCCC